MRLNNPLLSIAALSPLALAQNLTQDSGSVAPTALVTVDVIETFTTSFTGAQASLGNVTLYVPVPTIVPASATSGLLRYANSTHARATTSDVSATPIIIPAGNMSYTLSAGAAPTTLPFFGGGDRSVVGCGVLLGAAAGVAILF